MSVPEGAVLLTPSEVAGLFNVATVTVTRWGKQGLLLTIRTPTGDRRYFAAEVSARLRGEDPVKARELAVAARERLTGART